MLHDQTNFCIYLMYSSLNWKRKYGFSGYGLLWISHDVEFSAFDSSQPPGLPYPIETNTSTWLSSGIIEQDFTAVIRFVNLLFDFGSNPLRFVVAQSDLSGCDVWNYVWGKKWTANYNLDTHNFRSLQVSLPTIQQAGDKKLNLTFLVKHKNTESAFQGISWF